MAATVLIDVQLLVGGYDIGPFSGEFGVNVEAAMEVANNFAGRGYNVVLPGVTKATGMIKGHSDYATAGASATFNTAARGTQYAVGIIPSGSGAVAGDSAQFMRCRMASMKMLTGGVGDVADFEMQFESDDAEVDGYVGAVLASRTTTGLTGTAVQIVGGVPAGKRLYAAQYVTATTGTNLATIIQSDTVGFPSPVTAITLSTVSATGWQFTSVAGPITDDYFRVVSTIGTNLFTYAVLFGVQ